MFAIRGQLALSAWVAVCLLAGCIDKSAQDSGPAGPDNLPQMLELSGQVIVGFSEGRIRKSVDLPVYRIAKHPVTNADYDACVATGACEAIDGPTCEAGLAVFTRFNMSIDDPKSPAVCVGQARARTYCEWLGGRLPTLPEWQLAARGQRPKRYQWGEKEGNCEQHPFGLVPLPKGQEHKLRHLAKSRRQRCPQLAPKQGGKPTPVLRISAGSKSDAEGEGGFAADVLITPGELLAGSKNGSFNPCLSEARGCLVYGRYPGGMDSVLPMGAVDNNKESGLTFAYAFRCVLPEEN